MSILGVIEVIYFTGVLASGQFFHNCFIHPLCGIVWAIADGFGLAHCIKIKSFIVKFTEEIHEVMGPEAGVIEIIMKW